MYREHIKWDGAKLKRALLCVLCSLVPGTKRVRVLYIIRWTTPLEGWLKLNSDPAGYESCSGQDYIWGMTMVHSSLGTRLIWQDLPVECYLNGSQVDSSSRLHKSCYWICFPIGCAFDQGWVFHLAPETTPWLGTFNIISREWGSTPWTTSFERPTRWRTV